MLKVNKRSEPEEFTKYKKKNKVKWYISVVYQKMYQKNLQNTRKK